MTYLEVLNVMLDEVDEQKLVDVIDDETEHQVIIDDAPLLHIEVDDEVEKVVQVELDASEYLF